MTSNIGSQYLADSPAVRDGVIPERVRNYVMNELRSHFRPEFLNRIDEIVLFKPLTQQEITKIVELQVNYLRARLSERRIEIELTEEARRHIATQGYDPTYGARPLKRFIQRHIETPLAKKILAGEVQDNSRVVVDVKDVALEFRVESLESRTETVQ